MLKRQQNQKIGFILLMILGMIHVSIISALELNSILQNMVALIPLQVLALLYVGYFWRTKHLAQIVKK